MDAKNKKYIGYVLYIVLLVTGLNALFGGDPMNIGGYSLLTIVAVLTPIYYFLVGRKKQ